MADKPGPDKPKTEAAIDPEISEEIRNEQAKLRPARRASQQTRAKRLQQMRILLECSEDEFRQALAAAGTTGESAEQAMKIWRANRS